MHETPTPKKQAEDLGETTRPAEYEQRKSVESAERLVKALKYRVAFEQLAADISTQLSMVTADTADAVIHACLRRIAEFTHVDRAYLFRLAGYQFQNCYEWVNPAELTDDTPLPTIPVTSLPWLLNTLEQFEPVHIPQVAGLPEEASLEKALFARYDAFTVLILPLTFDRQLIGFMGLNTNQDGKRWSAADIALLRLLTGSFAHALEHSSWAEQPGISEPAVLQQQRHLGETITTLLTTGSPEELWQVVTRAARRLLSTERIAIYLYDLESETLSCPVALGLTEADETQLCRLIPPKTWADPHPKVINQVATAPEKRSLRDLLLRENLHTYAVFPLSAADKVMGAFLIFRDEPHSISVPDLITGQTLAQVVALALRNLQQLATTTYALTREQQLSELTRLMNSSPDLPTILAHLIRLSTQIIDADAGILSLVIDDQVMISYPYNVPNYIGLRPAPKGKGTAWYALETGQTLCLTDYQQHPEAQPDWVEAGITAFLSVPIVTGQVSLGALELFSLSPERRFSQRDQELAEAIGRHAALAIQKTQQLAQAQQRVGNLTALLTRQEAVDNLKNRFIQNISHELRTPLGIIHGYAELLESGSAGEMEPIQQDAVRVIAGRIRMLNNLVDDLTTLLAAETQDFQRERIDPIMLMYSMLADFQIQAADAGITLKSEFAESMPHIMGNITNLRRVFDNLVGNAFKATPAGGTITLRMWAEEQAVIIEVEDTGIGIPADKLDRIFERFYQLDVHPTRKYEGTGLGLALVQEIIGAHRGQVAVRSQVDQGTTFQLRLPALPDSP